MSRTQTPTLTEETQHFAAYIAMVVRNAMEDFHCEHLTDEQMMELNPIVRGRNLHRTPCVPQLRTG